MEGKKRKEQPAKRKAFVKAVDANAAKIHRYIRLRVLPGGEIRLSAPVGVDPLLLKQFLSQRGDWLARQSE